MTIESDDLLAWQRVRRYAVPRPMIAECTRLREAGDWRGACAAAGVEVAFEEPDEPIRADLLRLAPDLLRGQVPLAPAGLPCQLTADLAVEVPRAGSRRLRLSLRRPVGTFLDLAPWHWDATATDGLRTAYAGSAHQASGMFADGTPVADEPTSTADLDPAWHSGAGQGTTSASRAYPAVMLAEARRVADRHGVRRVGLLAGGAIDVAGGAGGDRTPGPGPLAWPGPPDPDLLRHKLIAIDDLHPLVVTGLAPGHRAPAAKLSALLAPVPVRCRGEWHTLVHHGSELCAVNHPTGQEAREETLHAFGGPMSGCFTVRHAWMSGGWVSRPLRRLRSAIREHLALGDWLTVAALLDAGMDPRHRNRGGATLLHLLRLLPADHHAVRPSRPPAPPHAALLTRLLAAGLPVDTRDGSGRTPLWTAIAFGTSPELVCDLLAAGADPRVGDNDGVQPVEMAGKLVEQWGFVDAAAEMYQAVIDRCRALRP